MKILAEPIKVIAIFPLNEKPRPYKFKLREFEIKIEQIISTTETIKAGIRAFEYLCQSVISNIQKQYVIKYVVKECRWELYKM